MTKAFIYEKHMSWHDVSYLRYLQGIRRDVSIYNKRTSFCGRSLCLSRIMCQHRLLPQNETCPNMSKQITTRCRDDGTDRDDRDDAIWRNNQHHHQMSIASPWWRNLQVLGRFPTINSITGRWLSYREANSKTIRLYARQKFPGFDRGSGYSFFHKKQSNSIWERWTIKVKKMVAFLNPYEYNVELTTM
jgi:hypothetical protein